MTFLVGTSGWHYPQWRGGLYPSALASKNWLEHYASSFSTVELNNAFYRLPEEKTFVEWSNRVPRDFVFAVKASRYLTHVRRLREPQEPVTRLVDRARGLGAKLGPILLQLPPNLRADASALDETMRLFPSDVRVAVEFRHESWFETEVRRTLERRNAALCLTDFDGPREPPWRTAEWGYVRFHHGKARCPSCYGNRALETWVEKLIEMWSKESDVYVYFNNDAHGCAPHDARSFGISIRNRGLEVSRLPGKRPSLT